MTDALIYDNATAAARVQRVTQKGGRANVVTRRPTVFEAKHVTPYMHIDETSDAADFLYPRLYLHSLETDDAVIDRVIERVAEGAALFVRAAETLDEVGRLDVRFHLSPVMLLHKLGVLDNALLTGGIYLDNDDVDLMIQCNARLVLLPSTDIGGGKGIPNTVSYLGRGLAVGIGTGDGVYTQDVRDELTLLKLITNAQMCSPCAIDERQAAAILDF